MSYYNSDRICVCKLFFGNVIQLDDAVKVIHFYHNNWKPVERDRIIYINLVKYSTAYFFDILNHIHVKKPCVAQSPLIVKGGIIGKRFNISGTCRK